MNWKITQKVIYSVLLATIIITTTECTSPAPEWQQKNEELISEHNLQIRELHDVPITHVESNLEAGKVKNLDQLDSIELYPGVKARIFWGEGTMVSILQLEPNAQIPEEVLPAERFVFVLEGSIDQLINGSPVTLRSKEREEPDGTHSGTPRMDFLYLEQLSKNAVTAGASGAKLIEVYSPVRLDYLQKAGVENSRIA